MKTPEIVGLIVRYIPSLIALAEGIFSWKAKSGPDKKDFVTGALKTVVGAVAAESTGGQANTWAKIAPTVDKLIDASVELANEVGAFSNLDSMTKGVD